MYSGVIDHAATSSQNRTTFELRDPPTSFPRRLSLELTRRNLSPFSWRLLPQVHLRGLYPSIPQRPTILRRPNMCRVLGGKLRVSHWEAFCDTDAFRWATTEKPPFSMGLHCAIHQTRFRGTRSDARRLGFLTSAIRPARCLKPW